MASTPIPPYRRLPPSIEVLVIGAGPVGLACAITLAREGQEVLVVDAASVNPAGCRASVIHANTLEVLDTIGCGDTLAAFGNKVNEIRMYNETTQVMSLPMAKFLTGLTKYPFLCGIPQHETERILREKLQEAGVQLVRGKRLESYREVEGGVEVTFEDGDVVSTKYLVGADGSRSTVRRLAGIGFKDPYTGFSYDSAEAKSNRDDRMILSDVEVEGSLPKNMEDGQFTIHFSGTTLMINVPLASVTYSGTKDNKDPSSAPTRFFRFGTSLREGDEEPPKVLTVDYVERLMNSRNHHPTPFRLKSIYSATKYIIRSAVADRFFVPLPQGGNILLAGDSAHVHSPVGGQGLNMGVCDAVALGRAIGAHSRQTEKDDTVLIKYAEHRHAWKQWVRDIVMYVVWSVPKLQSLLTWRISGLVLVCSSSSIEWP